MSELYKKARAITVFANFRCNAKHFFLLDIILNVFYLLIIVGVSIIKHCLYFKIHYLYTDYKTIVFGCQCNIL